VKVAEAVIIACRMAGVALPGVAIGCVVGRWVFAGVAVPGVTMSMAGPGPAGAGRAVGQPVFAIKGNVVCHDNRCCMLVF
jgi:hypothetical protein